MTAGFLPFIPALEPYWSLSAPLRRDALNFACTLVSREDGSLERVIGKLLRKEEEVVSPSFGSI